MPRKTRPPPKASPRTLPLSIFTICAAAGPAEMRALSAIARHSLLLNLTAFHDSNESQESRRFRRMLALNIGLVPPRLPCHLRAELSLECRHGATAIRGGYRGVLSRHLPVLRLGL